MSRNKRPTLKFGETREIQGFTSWRTASFNDIPPARVIREILQNSLDAAVEADVIPAVVRFRVTKIKHQDIPDIAGYKKAFRAAVAYHKNQNQGKLPDAAQQVVDTIDATLKKLAEDGHYLLSVLDNGVGLDEKRMNALFSDGTSVKATSAAGSYGVGHFAAISASNLRYLLYGGVQKGGKKIAAGYAVLASHEGKECPCAAQGYLIKRFMTGKKGELYEFIDGKSIPDILATDLEKIRKKWKHGTVISIPAFNYFGDYEQNLWHIVSKIASYNFSVAIHRGALVIEVEEELEGKAESGVSEMMRLDSGTLGDVLEEEKEEKRAPRRETFFEGLRPSGRNAYSIYETLVGSDCKIVKTELGDVSVNLLNPAPAGNTRIDLFRNGMWITDEISRLKKADFADRQPFHAVLVPREGHELHRLVRKAEGTMHDKLSFNLLDLPDEKKKLLAAFREIAAWIREQIPKLGDSEYTPDDFLVVPTGGEGVGGGLERFEMWGRPVVVNRSRVSQRRFTTSDEDTNHEQERKQKSKKKNRGNKKKTRQVRSSPLPFQSTVVPDGKKSHIVSLKCKEAFDDVTLSLRIDENMDATCDRIWPDEKVPIRSFEIDVKGAQEPIVEMDDEGGAIRLQGLSAGKTYKLVLKHDPPEGLENAVELPVLRVDLHRTRLEHREEDSGNVNED